MEIKFILFYSILFYSILCAASYQQAEQAEQALPAQDTPLYGVDGRVNSATEVKTKRLTSVLSSSSSFDAEAGKSVKVCICSPALADV